MKIRTLFLVFWIILSAVGILGFANRTQASFNFELSYPGQPEPLFFETNLSPLGSVTKQITVRNSTTDTQKFGLNLQNLLGTPDGKLDTVLTADISRGGILLYSSKLSELKNTETFLENIPSGESYIYDIKVTMADVGNDYQGQEVKFDWIFGWLKKTPKSILGESTGPSDITNLPQTGYNALSSISWILVLLFFVASFETHKKTIK